MSAAPEEAALYERLGRLEGLLMGVQSSLGQHRDYVASFLPRVERLEQRQVQLEAHQVTREDLRRLEETVGRLATAEAASRGSRSLIRELVPWLALGISALTLAVAILALLGVGQNRRIVDQRLPPVPLPPVNQPTP